MDTTLEIPSVDSGTFAFGAGIEAHRWSAIITPSACLERAASSLETHLELEEDTPVVRLCVDSPWRFIAEVQARAGQTSVLSGVESFTAEDWHTVDEARSRLLQAGRVVLVLTSEAFTLLDREAPNLASLLDGSVRRWDDIEGRLKAQRLEVLRAQTGLSDAEVMALAESGNLPSDPEYAEWLLLLGQGDLLGQ